MTTIYLVRHSEPFKVHRGIEDVKENLLFSNIKTPLSVNGEKMAEEKSMDNEFNNLDTVWSSSYVRAMSTAKYFAHRNNIKVNVSDNFCERKHGISSWEELPANFEINQFNDENYKIGDGESQKETRERMYLGLQKILCDFKDKNVLIVGHSTATAYLLSKWCEISYDGDYKYKGDVFFDGKWDYLQTFKLEFDDNYNLVSIKNLGGVNFEHRRN